MKHISLIFAFTLTLFLTACGGSGNSSTTAVSNDTTTTPTPVDTPIRVACVGDSITQGVGVSNQLENNYPKQMGRLLGEGWNVQNYGKSGATLVETGDNPYIDTAHYVHSHDFNPHIVVIMLGTNDLKPTNITEIDRYVSDYKTLIESYKNLPSKPAVYICKPPPSYGNFRGITNTNIVNVLLPRIEIVSQQNNVPIIDIYSALSNKKHLFPDTLHPNLEGASIIAHTVAASIQ